MRSRREFLSLAAGLASPPARRPNVLVLLTDDQRFDTIQALGNREVRTPNIDRIVRHGTAFTHAFIMGGTIPAVCSPSRAMLLTGQHLFRADRSIVRPKDPLPFALMPEHFRKSGYATFGTGKWHNGPALYARCFSHGDQIFFGGMSDHDKVPVHAFDPSGEYPREQRRIGAGFSTEIFSDAAIRFLRGHRGDQPFFAYVSYTAPHDPRTAPGDYASLYPPDRVSLPPNFLPEHPFDNGEMKIRDEMLAPFPRTPEAVREHIAAYYAMITHLDAQIGRVLDALEETGQADNTIVVFASDNGLAVGQHGLMGKQNLYDHSVRVPLVLAGPGVPRGRREHGLCYLHDLFPTLCGLAALWTPREVESASLGANLRAGRDSLFLAYKDVQRGVRTGRWKYIVYLTGQGHREQLFDLENDPWERKNLAGSNLGRLRRMRTLLARWMRDTGDPLRSSVPL